MLRRPELLLTLMMVACDFGDGKSEPDSDDTSDTALPDDSVPDGTPTYYADVWPVMAQHCLRCHSGDGLGLGDFSDAEEAALLAPAIGAAVEDGRMPPPVSDPSCQDYAGSDNLSLSDEEKSIILDWVSADAPLGDPEDRVDIEQPSHNLADPDITLMMSEPYTPTYADPDNPGNEYRCFILDKPEGKEEFYITALAPVIDQSAIAHHAVLFTSNAKDLAPYEEELKAGQGFDCIDDLSPASGMLAAWAPGMMPIEFPENMGIGVDDDDILVLQMHYYYSGPETKDAADLSGYAFNIADDVDDEIYMAPLGSFDFLIPAGDDDYTHTSSFYNGYLNLKVHAVFPHMHVLGQAYDARVIHSDGSESCLVTGDYDFDNQMTYQFDEPVPFENGDTIQFSCNWNNSTSNPDLPGDSPTDTSYGERTDEEMCYFFSFVSL